MLGYNRTITSTNIKVLLNIGPEAAEDGKEEEVKSNSLPNTFDDDCSKWKNYKLVGEGPLQGSSIPQSRRIFPPYPNP